MKLKVISLNLWDGGSLFPNIVAFLQQHADADILMLQEVYNSHDQAYIECYRSLDALKERLDYQYEHFAPVSNGLTLAGKIDEGNAVLSKFPIIANDTHFFVGEYGERNPYLLTGPGGPTDLPHNLQHVVIDANGTVLNVFNFQGVVDYDGDNFSEKRRRMSEDIIEHVGGKQYVILAGDTNARPTNQAMRNIEEHLTSVFGTELKSTYNMRRKTNPGYATSACDHMYVSADIKVLAKDCPDVDISDHLPLVVELEITNNGKEQ